jgi:hypothetical protein
MNNISLRTKIEPGTFSFQTSNSPISCKRNGIFGC